MAFIPSEALACALSRVKVGLWIEPLIDERIALVCKMPEAVIKALYRGAKCSLTVAIVEAESLGVLCLGFRVYDEPEHPLTVVMPKASSQDLDLLSDLVTSRYGAIHCLNELDHPVLSAWVSLEAHGAKSALDVLRSSGIFLLSPSSGKSFKLEQLGSILELALRRFQTHIHRSAADSSSEFILMSAVIDLELNIWLPTEIFEVSLGGLSGPFQIDDSSEGPKQERLIVAALSNIYGSNAYGEPQVREGGKFRELTDVLAFDSESLCLLESKSISILTSDLQQSTSRRVATLKKRVGRGLRQLRGAVKRVRSGVQIFDADREPIAVPSPPFFHAIMLLPEMYFFLDWKAIAETVSELSEDATRRAFYHVLDMLELAYLAANSQDASMFNDRLLQRWVAVKEKGSAYCRATMPISYSS